VSPVNPTRISRFEVLDRLGHGGMGVVYLASDPMLGRTVAIKVLSEFSAELRARFAREARSAAFLSHHNIVQIYDIGEDEGRPFIAMEYVDGETLGELIRRRPMFSLDRKLRLMLELCSGLDYAHRNGLIHRDIKPANVMITSAGVVKILDFGLARLATEITQAGLTRVGQILGTPHYMSPEQVEGRQQIDHRSDIFAVGLVLYELLTYRKAFPGDSPHSVMHRIVHNDPPPIVEFCPSIDPDLVEVVNKAIQKAPEDRYSTLAQVAGDLTRILGKLPEPADDSTVRMEQILPTKRTEGNVRTPTPNVRHIPNLESIERRRAAQIEQHIEQALKRYQAGDYQMAIEECESAVVLDPQNARVLDLLQRAHAAIEDQQVQRWLQDAEDHLAQGALSEAQVLIEESLELRPELAEAQRLHGALEERRRENERVRERARALGAALNRARAHLEARALEAALRSVNEALAYDPTHAEAKELKQRATDALEQRQREHEHEQRALEAVATARAHAAYERHEEALRLLRGFSPAHALVDAAMAEIVADHAALQQRRREEEDARRRRAAEEERSRREAEQLVRQLEAARRRDQEEERRRQETELPRREASAAAHKLAARDALQADHFSDAMTALELAHAATPNDPEIGDLRAQIEIALTRHDEALRLRNKVAQCMESATKFLEAGDLGTALRCVDAALAVQSGNQAATELRTKISALINARSEQEQRQRAGERAIIRARQMFVSGEYEAAIHFLEEFVPAALVAPVVQELRTELRNVVWRRQEEEARKAADLEAAQRAQEEERRRVTEAASRIAEEETARRAAEATAQRQARERALRESEERALRQAEDHAHREAKEVRREGQEQALRNVDEEFGPKTDRATPRPRVSRGAILALAAAVLAMVFGSWFLRRPAPPPPPIQEPKPTVMAAELVKRAEAEYTAGHVSQSIATALSALDRETGYSGATSLLQRIRSEATKAATAARDDAIAQRADGGEPFKKATGLLTAANGLTDLRQTDLAVQQYHKAEEAFRTAIAAIATDPNAFLDLARRAGAHSDAAIQYAQDGLKIDPTHRGLREFLHDLRTHAEKRASSARDDAARAGATEGGSTSFKEAVDRMREASRIDSPAQTREAVNIYAAAQKLYEQATGEANTSRLQLKREALEHVAEGRRQLEANDLKDAREELNQAEQKHGGTLEATILRRDIDLAEAHAAEMAKEAKRRDRENEIQAYLGRAKALTPADRVPFLGQAQERFPNEQRITEALAAARAEARKAPVPTREITPIVRKLLDAYYDAYRAMDFTALKVVFPNATDQDRKRLKALSDNYTSCTYQRGEPIIKSVADTDLYATVDVTETCIPKVRTSPIPPLTSRAQFYIVNHPGKGWIIETGP
jgi:serine/threonine-protein kinase